LGSDRSVEWLAYRYETNPYRDGPPMVVAETDGHVVGARPFVPLPMRVGHTDVTAVYLGNLMVHPEHRRQGLFTRMTELATELYADTDSDFFFNFANERSAPGYRKLDFEAVATGPEKQFRVQNPGQVVRDRMRLPAGRYLGVAADAAMDSYLSLRRRGPTRAGYEVERLSGIPAELVAELYEADHPTALHTRREETFYRWLANGPYWEYETYVASSDGTPPPPSSCGGVPCAGTATSGWSTRCPELRRAPGGVQGGAGLGAGRPPGGPCHLRARSSRPRATVLRGDATGVRVPLLDASAAVEARG